jgi:murein DD-endopeptidase MepM/ murein hydrolase activator NlpD
MLIWGMTVTKLGLAGLVLSFAWQAVPLAAPALAMAARDTPPVQPLNGTPAITANFGAHGPGPVSDPDAYFSGQFHLGTDYGAAAGTPVVAPVSGTIVYYHQLRNSPREVRLLDTFFVLRGDDGRDYIFAHVVCSVCVATPPVGDPDAYPKVNWRPVTAGDPIGTVADLKAEAKRLGYSASVGNHLHLGVVQGQIVDDEGRLKTAYRGGDWSRLLYDKAEDANPVTAIARAKANGFVNPKLVLAALTSGGLGMSSLPKDMLPAHQTALRTYLQSRPQFRMARTADYPAWEENKKYIWSSYANRNPYYVSAELDRDGMLDFAVVLVNDQVKTAPNNPFGFNCNLVVFKGYKDGSYREVLFKANVGSPEGSLLFHDRASNSLAIGLWEGGVSQIQVTRGGQFRYVQ